jgi:hypothetical protein
VYELTIFVVVAGMGYLGISFLTEEQNRRNELIRLDVEGKVQNSDGGEKSNAKNGAAASSNKDKSSTNASSDGQQKTEQQTPIMMRAKKFQRSAAPFIFFTAMPYMLQIIGFGNMNKFAFTCLEHEMHRTVRLNELFDHDNNLAAMAANSATSPEGRY